MKSILLLFPGADSFHLSLGMNCRIQRYFILGPEHFSHLSCFLNMKLLLGLGLGWGLSNLSTDCLAGWYRVINLQRWEIASTDQMASILGNGQWRGKGSLGRLNLGNCPLTQHPLHPYPGELVGVVRWVPVWHLNSLDRIHHWSYSGK